ncbi:MAG TPA: hypothetical protein VIL97_10305 [Thermoanaerobaculia bacterium]
MSETRKRMNAFERDLSLWVALCMIAGVILGKALRHWFDPTPARSRTA